MEFTGERFIPDMGLDAEIEVEHFLRYYSVSQYVKGKMVLDAASGSGYGTNLLAEYAFSAHGLELSSEAVEFAKNKYGKDNLQYVQGSIAQIPFPDHFFDVVVSFETIEHVNGEIQKKFLDEIKRVLKTEGTLIISTPDKKIYSDLPGFTNLHHVKEFYREEFYDFLTGYYENVEFFEQVSQLCHLLASKRSSSVGFTANNNELQNGKYIIAVCSQAELIGTDSIANMYFNSHDEYQQKLARITQLQEEVYERNEHIKLLDTVISNNNATINRLQNEVVKLTGQVAEHKVLSVKSGELLAAQGEEMKDAQQQVAELKAELGKIKRTKAWKLIQKVYRLMG